MRGDRFARRVAWFGGAIVLVGLIRAYIERDESSPVLAIVVLVVGTALVVLTSVVLEIWSQRARLPRTTPASACASIGVLDVVAGPMVSGWFGVIGVVLVAAALLSYGRVLRGDGGEGSDMETARSARALIAFAADHGGHVRVAIERVGGWHRLVAVASDGAYGDFVVRTADQARRAAELALADVVEPTDSAVLGGLRTGPYEWRRMARAQLGR